MIIITIRRHGSIDRVHRSIPSLMYIKKGRKGQKEGEREREHNTHPPFPIPIHPSIHRTSDG